MKNTIFNGAIAFFAVAAAVVSFVGCKDKSRPSDLPEGVSCVLWVVQDGKPLEGAELMLVAQDEANKKYSPGGTTDAEGAAEIKTYGYPGVAPGKYKVLVWKYVEEGGETVVNNESGEESRVGGEEFQTVDPTFFDAATTTFEVDVAKKMEKTVFDVGEAVRIPKK